VAAVVDAMFETMYDAAGIGLAAPQVGIARRFFVYDVKAFGKGVVCNPEFVRRDGEVEHSEGCLSLPGISGITVDRPTDVVVRARDEKGAVLEIAGTGLAAAMLCHESDHLAGQLIIDVATRVERKRALREWRILEEEHAGGIGA
jgi:peptide deformylase